MTGAISVAKEPAAGRRLLANDERRRRKQDLSASAHADATVASLPPPRGRLHSGRAEAMSRSAVPPLDRECVAHWLAIVCSQTIRSHSAQGAEGLTATRIIPCLPPCRILPNPVVSSPALSTGSGRAIVTRMGEDGGVLGAVRAKASERRRSRGADEVRYRRGEGGRRQTTGTLRRYGVCGPKRSRQLK